ncbi:MAG: sigma-70 family RNA polymerase sigma factor [Chthonomonas sp.]|nr:sigma-70 family RNA polymerase sigma factor [Chthonomonas sp.]
MNLSVPLNSRGFEARSSSVEDDLLVERARNGDYHAFELLFERHRMLVYRYVYQMVPYRDEAEDMVQEVFVRAHQHLARYRDEAKFTTWLLRIATNLATDRARMNQRRTALEQREAAGALTWMTTPTNEDPVDSLESERRLVLLRKVLQALPEHHRSILILRDIEEREYTEIAGILGCTVGGAKLRVLRARRALRDRMAPLLGDDNP